MNNKKTIQKILIGLGIAIALLVVYSFIAQNPQQGVKQTGLLSSMGDSGMGQIEKTDAQLVNADILRVLGSIEDIDLKDDIFSNPVFRKLKDTHFSIPRPVKIGRPNPFLPIGFDSIAAQEGNISFGSNPFANFDMNANNPFANNVENTNQQNNFFNEGDGAANTNLNT